MPEANLADENGWIKLKDRLPDEEDQYLVFVPSADPNRPLIAFAEWDAESKRFYGLATVWIRMITHYQKPKWPAEYKQTRRI